MSLLSLVVASLATWRITHMLLRENGPWSLFRRLRQRLGVKYVLEDSYKVESFRYEITVCLWCLSVWVGAAASAVVVYLPDWLSLVILLPYAISAVAVALDRLFGMEQ